ncbi:MAG: ComF family protein [Treponema sp.]|nr:ComF family protein [Treponema sp.]
MNDVKVWNAAVFRVTLATAARNLLSLLWGGEHCICCGKPSLGEAVCQKCKRLRFLSFVPPGPARCDCCGKVLLGERGRCMDCRRNVLLESVDAVLPLYPYRLWYKEALFSWKMKCKRSLSPLFARAAASALNLWCGGRCVLVPVPPRPGKLRHHGWDQIQELCWFLHALYGFSVMHLLERLSVNQQKKLRRAERIKGASNSYAIAYHSKRWWRSHGIPDEVVLVDDVLTTGVTAESCARLLKSLGIEKVRVLTLFIVD